MGVWGVITCSGKTKENEYAVTLEFFNEIDPKVGVWRCR